MNVSMLKKFVETTSQRLFEAERRRLDRLVESLDRQNREIKKYQAEGFLFQGKFYCPKNAQTTTGRGTAKQSLSFTLQDQGNEMLVDHNKIDHDQKIIEQFLYKTLYNCTHWQNIRDTLPACLLQFWPELQRMEPSGPSGYLAPKDERYQREAEKVIPKIEFYSVVHLIY